MTFMPKPCARRATAWPMRPKPTMPRVLPAMSPPSSIIGSQPLYLPARMNVSPSTTRRADASSRAQVKSAVESVRTPGVFTTTTPRALHAFTSMWS
jgi:hypothetical protein